MATTTKSVKVPLARVWSQAEGGTIHRTLAWGDRVDFVKREGKNLVVDSRSFEEQPDGTVTSVPVRGYIRHDGETTASILAPATHKVLAVDFVDVQQGDAAVIESPKGAVMLVDGGESQLFARYLANRFAGTTAAAPREIDTIVVSHGDADHFAGLPKILDSETDSRRRKRLFIDPRRVFHNGLAKGPSSLRDVEMFGATEDVNGRPHIIDLVDDLRTLPPARLNRPFRAWKATLEKYGQRAQAAGKTLVVERLERGSAAKFLSFMTEDIRIDVLAPITVPVATAGRPEAGPPVPGQAAQEAVIGRRGHVRLPFRLAHRERPLRRPAADLREVPDPVHGDLNEESENMLIAADAAGTSSLESDVLKVPHHGSADYLPSFLKAVGALISVVSSGDESAQKEYIHPRATLVGGLGRHSRVDDPLVFVTELVAFFAKEGYVGEDWHEMTAEGTTAVSRKIDVVDIPTRKKFFGFSRSAFGTVHVRTDGKRLLV